MSIAQVPGGFYLPHPIAWDRDFAPGFVKHTLNATTRKIAFIVRAAKSGQLESFGFRAGAANQRPANGLVVSFQDVATGVPVNSPDYSYIITSGAIAEEDWNSPPYLTTDGTNTGLRRQVVHGELIACVIEFASYQAGDEIEILVLTQDAYSPKGAYVLTADSVGAWTKVAGNPLIELVHREGETVVYDRLPLIDAFIATLVSVFTISPSYSPDEIGLVFQLPAPMRVGGAYVLVDQREKFDLTLYDEEAGTVLEQVRVELGSYYPNPNGVDYVFVRFTQDLLIGANQNYVLSVTPVGSGEVDIYFFELTSATHMESAAMGATWYYRERTDAGDWTEYPARRPFFGLLVTGVDHDTSGGSGGPGWLGNP